MPQANLFPESPRPAAALVAALAAFAFLSLIPAPARADGWAHGRGRPVYVGHGWHEGHWVHDRHHGRLGWWWVVGPAWHFYARPYPAYPPRTVIIEQAPPPQVTLIQAPPAQPAPAPVPAPAPAAELKPVLYYCKATGTYYPDTLTCPAGWSIAAAGVPPAP